MPSAGLLAGLSILVVEDDSDTRTVLSAGLRQHGARVLEADSGPAGLRMFASEHPRVMVVDLSMPEMDGFEFLEAVHELPNGDGRRTPAIAVTAHNSVEDRVATLKAGFSLHLAKPIEPNGLARVLKSLLSG